MNSGINISSMFPQTVDYVLSHRVNFYKIIQYGMTAMLYKVLINFVFKKINLKTIPFFTDLTKTMQCPNSDFKFIPFIKVRPLPLFFFSNFSPNSQSLTHPPSYESCASSPPVGSTKGDSIK